MSLQYAVFELNKRIIEAHYSHYVNNVNELIDVSTNASPNENQIYHLYSNGEITHQKGAWAYLKRSEFFCQRNIPGTTKLDFKFVLLAADKTTYVILTKEECYKFREEMAELCVNTDLN